MPKTLPTVFMLVVALIVALFQNPAIADDKQLDIQWKDNKLSMKARSVSLCEVLEKISIETNTKIRNDNSCDNLVNFTIEKKSFDEAIKKILKHDSYVLIDNNTERRLLVYNRNSSQQGGRTSIDRSIEPTYVQDVIPPDTSNLNNLQQPYDQYQEPQATDASGTGMSYEQPVDTNAPNPSEPPANPEGMGNSEAEGIPNPDPQ